MIELRQSLWPAGVAGGVHPRPTIALDHDQLEQTRHVVDVRPLARVDEHEIRLDDEVGPQLLEQQWFETLPPRTSLPSP